MTQEAVEKLNDSELVQVIKWAQNEQKSRAERLKHEAISKIKQLARSAGVTVSVEGNRGRPVARKPPSKRT